MADKTIQGTGVVDDGMFGFIPGTPTRPEDPSKWEIKWLTPEEVGRRCGGATLDQLLMWKDLYGFPRPRVRFSRNAFTNKETRKFDWNEFELTKFFEQTAEYGFDRCFAAQRKK